MGGSLVTGRGKWKDLSSHSHLQWGKANMLHFRYISRPKMHILSTRLLGVPFGPQGAMPDPAPHRGVPGTKVLIKSQKSVPGTNPGRYLGPSWPGGLNCSRFSSPRGSCHGPGIGFRSGPGDRSLLPSRRILGFRSMAGAIGPNVTSFLGRRHSLAPLQ